MGNWEDCEGSTAEGPVDLESVADLLDRTYQVLHLKQYGGDVMAGPTMQPVAKWELAGACLEKMAKLGYWPILEACGGEWQCHIFEHTDLKISKEYGEAADAIIACAAEVQKLRSENGR